MSLLTSRDSHSLDTYQSKDPRIKIAAQRIAPLEYMLRVIENMPPNSFAGLEWIRNRCGRSLERMGMIRIRRAYAQRPRPSAKPTKHRMFHTDRTRYSENPLPAKTLVGGFDICQPAVRAFTRHGKRRNEYEELTDGQYRILPHLLRPFIRKPASLNTPRQDRTRTENPLSGRSHLVFPLCFHINPTEP